MSHVIDVKKCETGISEAYRHSFKGHGREPRERVEANKKFEKNYNKIDWSKK